ncbi:MAG: hypothetical protein LBG67_04070 [Campylobacteraceae bacterium]|jgi:hypothetical protein|nr:hypothetical protein [Campylobacteraceae bacterium]
MDIRTLKIDIWGYEWDISFNGKRGDDVVPKLFRTVDILNGKIVYVHDYSMSARNIKRAQEYGGVFLEECIFRHKEHTFKGNFIDAFIYIENHLESLAKAEGREHMRNSV